MYVTEVIPLTKNAPATPLSYYTSQVLPPGSVVTLPLRKREVAALVVHQDEAPLSKLTLKAASFTLRRLPEQETIRTVSPTALAVANELLKETPYQLGALLLALLPGELHTVAEHTPVIAHEKYTSDHVHQVNLLHTSTEERRQSHLITIRETFARGGSVLLIAPTSAEAVFWHQELQTGIEKRTVLLSPTRTKKQNESAYEAVRDLSKTKLIVTTPAFTCIDRPDLLHIIIEHGRSSQYKRKIRPYIDYKAAAIHRARLAAISVTLADILPHTEDEYARREGRFEPADESPQRISLPSSLELLTPPKEAEKPFLPLRKKAVTAIRHSLQAKGNVFVFAARRGLAPLIVCSDCGEVFRCPTSGAPYSLFKTSKNGEEQRWFVSSAGTRVRALDTCTQCGSWRLQELGIGIQRVEEQLREAFPDIPIITFDHTTATTPRKRLQLIASFYDEKPSILLGTQMALPYLQTPVTNTVMTSLDALRASPSWRSEEDMLALLLMLREKTSDTVYLQAKRDTEERIVSYAKTGQLDRFYDEEIALREKLHYPPFVHFVHLAFAGAPAQVQKTESLITETLTPYEVRFYTAPTSNAERTLRFGLLRITASDWPPEALLTYLRQLPPSVRVEVDPDKLV